jgi:hypothetical protein
VRQRAAWPRPRLAQTKPEEACTQKAGEGNSGAGKEGSSVAAARGPLESVHARDGRGAGMGVRSTEWHWGRCLGRCGSNFARCARTGPVRSPKEAKTGRFLCGFSLPNNVPSLSAVGKKGAAGLRLLDPAPPKEREDGRGARGNDQQASARSAA